MAKKSPFFSHDMNARNDPKMTAMMCVYGAQGYGIFWILVEMMAESDGYRLNTNGKYAYDAFAKQANCERNTMVSFIHDCITEFELFHSDREGNFWSPSLLRRMEYRDIKSKKAAESVQKRWEEAKTEKYETDTNELQTNNERNTNVSQNDTNVSNENTDVIRSNANDTDVIRTYNERNTDVSKIDTINKTKRNIKHIPVSTEKGIWEDMFEQLWFVYPLKHGKAEAKGKFKKYYEEKKGNVDVKDLLQRIYAYKAYCALHNRKYKDGSTFFSQRAWEENWQDEQQTTAWVTEEIVVTTEELEELNALKERQRQRMAAEAASKLRTVTS